MSFSLQSSVARRTWAALVLMAGASVLSASPAVAVPLGSFIYGIDNNNNIQEVNTQTQTATQVYTNGTIPAGTSNAFAYDTVRDQFFFVDNSNNLLFWNRTGNPTQIATSGDLGDPDPQPANAAYFNNAYWFFAEGTNTLNKVTFTYSGATPSFSSLDSYNLSQVGGSWDNSFGDIAIDIPNSMLYGATVDGTFYSVDLSSGTPTTANYITNGNPSLQLSFSYDYSTLYGQNFNGGQWGTVNTTSGAFSPIGGFAITFGGPNGLRDLGGASTTSAVVPEIDPTAFAGILAMVLGSLGLVERRRLAAIA